MHVTKIVKETSGNSANLNSLKTQSISEANSKKWELDNEKDKILKKMPDDRIISYAAGLVVPILPTSVSDLTVSWLLGLKTFKLC